MKGRLAYGLAGLALMFTEPGRADGNLTEQSYPPHACGAKPEMPVRPEKLETNAAVAAYNNEVEIYNTSVQTYVDCIQSYIDGASADIELIRSRIRSAVDEANR